MSTADCPFQIWSSGFTRRWHMNPVLSALHDYVCGHHGRCGQLIITLFSDHSIDLLRAAVTHDAAEIHVGDLSWPFKRVGGDLIAQHAALESRILETMGFPFAAQLSPRDASRLQFVDRLDAFLFVQLFNPNEAQTEAWCAVRCELLEQSIGLGCEIELTRMLAAARGGGQ